MPTQKKQEKRNKIKIIVSSQNISVVKRVQDISDKFNCVEVIGNIEDAVNALDDNSVLITDEGLLPDEHITIKKAVILVTGEKLNIVESSYISEVPLDIFFTKYLEEFILWASVKSEELNRDRHRRNNKEEIEKMIGDLQSLSRCSIIKEISQG